MSKDVTLDKEDGDNIKKKFNIMPPAEFLQEVNKKIIEKYDEKDVDLSKLPEDFKRESN